ncbi:MAG: TlpA family protein disulfide reductase, partial [Pyrinomonadaceae bacterium]|nr:TlpA family protein disulfide reductase [Pyrinomonadaceae bacterium]
MSRLLIFIALIIAFVVLPGSAGAQQATVPQVPGHEYAPLLEKKVDYKDWTFKNLSDGKPTSLRSLAEGKRLVLVVYFAPWCPNWKNEAPVAQRLYEKYKAQGLEVIGVSEYGSAADTRAFFGEAGAPFPVVIESEAHEDRDKTSHYGYRQLTGDTRKWGSPWNIFLETAKLAQKGDILVANAWVVNGELVEADVESFIRARLGVESKVHQLTTAAAPITPCKP